MSHAYIGLQGGTFDPIHFGHLRPALEVQMALNLEAVHFIPCAQPVHRDQPVANSTQRCDMIELAIASQPKFKLDSIELELGGASYTVNTLEALKERHPDKGLVLMMGTDAFAKFNTWHQWQRIMQLANLAIMHRPGEPIPQTGEVGQIFRHAWVPNLSELQGQIVDVPITQLDLSATALRSYLSQNVSVEFLMPDAVRHYIKRNQLYGMTNPKIFVGAKAVLTGE